MPVFALEAQEGRLFTPLAFTKTYAMAAAALLAVTLIPVLVGFCVRGRIRHGTRNPVSRFCNWFYQPVLKFALRFKALVLGLAVLGLAISAVPFARLGTEFMPALWEGDLLYMPTTLPGISITKARELLQQTDRIIAGFPEVERVFGKVGRAETATDPAPLSMIETTIMLKPREDWRPGTDPGAAHRGNGRRHRGAGPDQCLDHADQDPYRHAFHRHQDAGGHQDCRAGPHRARTSRQGDRSRGSHPAGHGGGLCRARHGRQLP